jgi:hypothetical protein
MQRCVGVSQEVTWAILILSSDRNARCWETADARPRCSPCHAEVRLLVLCVKKASPMPPNRMGSHIAPFHSVEHLHLHVHALPYKSPWRAVKYPVIPGQGSCIKGFSWFVEIEQAIQILERRKVVQILPCWSASTSTNPDVPREEMMIAANGETETS